WLEGETVDVRLQEVGFDLRETVLLGQRVASAIGAAHRVGLVHRDLKPSNLLIPSDGIEQVRLLDFGVARSTAVNLAITPTGAAVGTPGYMAPEQVAGSRDVAATSDVVALGWL